MSARDLIPCGRPSFALSDLFSVPLSRGRVREFEATFADRVGAMHGLAFAHGRLGFLAVLRSLGCVDAEIVLPAYTCPTMADAVLASGNRPVFVDINPDDFLMDLAELRRALSGRTRAIVITHLFGYRADVCRVREIVQDDRILIVEDCAHRFPPAEASPARFEPDVAIYSLGRQKPLSAIRGGVVAIRSAELFQRIRAERERTTRALPRGDVVRLWLWWIASYIVYQRTVYRWWQQRRQGRTGGIDAVSRPEPAVFLPGGAVAFGDFQARLALRQLARAESVLRRRRALALAYDRELSALREIGRPPIRPDATYSYYTIRVPRRDERNFPARMLAHGVMVGRTYDQAVPEGSPWLRPRGSFPVAEETAREIVNLPMHAHLDEADIPGIVEAVRRSLHPSPIRAS